MMLLGEASSLITPFLSHPNFDEFEKNTPRLQELKKQILKAMQKIDVDHFLGETFVQVDEQTEIAFREYVEICKQGLK